MAFKAINNTIGPRGIR
ncbi:polyprotein [Diplocarpon rosae]|nr:polyprotein [Diplocarpon rosae]